MTLYLNSTCKSANVNETLRIIFETHYHLEIKLQYEGAGVLKEHLHTRAPSSASLFDVSHMGQIRWHGKDAVKFIEQMVVGDIASLGVGEAKLSLIMNEDGGIVDDTVISNAGDYVYMVVNGGCKVRGDSSVISTCCF